VRALRASHDVVHSCGAITPERVDVATIHLCHAAVTNTWGRGGPGWRRANAALAGWLGRAIELRQLRGGGVSEVVAVSSQVARELTTHYPSVPHSTIPNGVDSPAAAPTRRDGSGPLAALMVTSDFATKGVELAIGALQFAPGVVLTVVGRGGAKPYEALARRIGVGDRVTFAGFVTDPNPYYRACDVVVCASHYEAFGLFLVEAALAGCAVVSTDVGVAPELVDGGAGGVIVERTPEAVGRALSACAADRAGTICRGEAARERAARFTTDAMAEGYGALYQRLTAAAAP
jgi:UDP-glucose:(heptosyl)LPS alpha-1,3-glucosyltransferase